MNEQLFYDIEIFQHDAIVVFMDNTKNVVAVYHNDFNRPVEGLFTGAIVDLVAPSPTGGHFGRESVELIGYNNYHYDDHILTGMLDNWTPHQLKELNDEIIHNKKSPYKVNPLIKSLDCFQQIAGDFPSLKKIEANMGKSIEESQVDFNITRPLTPEELESTIAYCKHDVRATVDVYKIREEDYFEPKKGLIKQLPSEWERTNGLRWNDTTISSRVVTQAERTNGRYPKKHWRNFILIPGEKGSNHDFFTDYLTTKDRDAIVKMWEENQWEAVPSEKKKPKTCTVNEFGCKIEFSNGGLHGVPTSGKKRFENVKLLDVASLYPTIIMHLNALGERTTAEYANIVARRLAVKHTNQPLQLALKLAINSCYGLMKNEYSDLYNFNAALSVCIFGQVLLYDLCKRLHQEAGCELININTDGVAFRSPNDDYKRIWKEWERDHSTNSTAEFVLEEKCFTLFIQKDVNNYIAVKEDGKIKVKGGDVGRYNEEQPFRNNSKRIIDIAVVECLVNGVNPRETIINNLHRPELFQMVLIAGPTYKGTCDVSRNMYQKVNRVFATNVNESTLLYKLRVDDGLVRFPDTPEKMCVYNHELKDFNNFKQVINKGFYLDLVQTVLERWQ